MVGSNRKAFACDNENAKAFLEREKCFSVLAYEGPRLDDAAFHEVRLDLKLLIRAQVNRGLKGQVSRERNAYVMLSCRDEHSSAMPVELICVSGELFVHEYGSPLGICRDFQFTRGSVRRRPRVLC